MAYFSLHAVTPDSLGLTTSLCFLALMFGHTELVPIMSQAHLCSPEKQNQ